MQKLGVVSWPLIGLSCFCLLMNSTAVAHEKVVVVPLGGNEASGDAIPIHVLKGKTFSNANASGLTGIRPNAVIPKTGQKDIYLPGDDGAYQKGASWPDPRFTDNRDGTVSDNLTGLKWLKDANCWDAVNWGSPIGDTFEIVKQLNEGHNFGCADYTAGTFANWRIPNINELESILHRSFMYPALPDTTGKVQWTEGNPFIDVRDSYWSSSAYGVDIGLVWVVHMYNGAVTFTDYGNYMYLWPVRGY